MWLSAPDRVWAWVWLTAGAVFAVISGLMALKGTWDWFVFGMAAMYSLQGVAGLLPAGHKLARPLMAAALIPAVLLLWRALEYFM